MSKTARKPNEDALKKVWDILCLPDVDLDMTVSEVRQTLMRGMTIENDKGLHNPCPACGMNNTTYMISFRRDYADQLIRLVDRHNELVAQFPDDPEEHWIDCPKFFSKTDQRQRDFTKMKRWALVEPHPTKAGHWRPTKAGIEFAMGAFPIPKWVCSFHDFHIGYTGEWIYVDDALKLPHGWSFDEHVRAGAEALVDLDDAQEAYMDLLKKRAGGAVRNRTKTSSSWDLYEYLYDEDLVEKVPIEDVQPGPKVVNESGMPIPDPSMVGGERKPKQLYLF